MLPSNLQEPSPFITTFQRQSKVDFQCHWPTPSALLYASYQVPQAYARPVDLNILYPDPSLKTKSSLFQTFPPEDWFYHYRQGQRRHGLVEHLINSLIIRSVLGTFHQCTSETCQGFFFCCFVFNTYSMYIFRK